MCTLSVLSRYNITYFASAGDSGWGAQWPSSVPWVVSAGGTTVQRDHTGNFLGESCWGRMHRVPAAVLARLKSGQIRPSSMDRGHGLTFSMDCLATLFCGTLLT